jgi:hypothetical protein
LGQDDETVEKTIGACQFLVGKPECPVTWLKPQSCFGARRSVCLGDIKMQSKGLRRRRPPAMWKGEVGKDAKLLGVRNWWTSAMNQEEKRKLVKEARTLYEL